MSEIIEAIGRLERSTWDSLTIPRKVDVRLLLDAYRDAAFPEPPKGKRVWYRGWEVYFSHTADQWTENGWIACLGGEDLDCTQVTSDTWKGLLDEIDDHDLSEGKA
jgi:hypothetical protein